METAVAGDMTTADAILQASNAFAASAEFRSQFNGLTTAAVIARVYQNLFGHDPDPSALQYWSLKLDTGEIPLTQIVRAVSDSAVAAGGVDGVAFTSKVTAAISFTASVDSTYEIAGYSGDAAGALARTWLSTITDAAGLSSAITPAVLDAVISSVADAGYVTPGQTFVLTTGVDTVTGTSNNDTINGALAGSFGALDSIDGGNGNDRLNITWNQSSLALGANIRNVESIDIIAIQDVVINVSGSVGVLHLNVTAGGNVDVTGPATLAVTVAGGGNVDQILTTSAGADTITGGTHNDTIRGGASGDTLAGGSGNDTFVYLASSDSPVVTPDSITDFSSTDFIRLTGIAGISNRLAAYPWSGSLSATVTAVQSDASVSNAAVFFSDGTAGYVFVKGIGSGMNFNGTLIKLPGVSATSVLTQIVN